MGWRDIFVDATYLSLKTVVRVKISVLNDANDDVCLCIKSLVNAN